jgi:hypothetical protein
MEMEETKKTVPKSNSFARDKKNLKDKTYVMAWHSGYRLCGFKSPLGFVYDNEIIQVIMD